MSSSSPHRYGLRQHHQDYRGEVSYQKERAWDISGLTSISFQKLSVIILPSLQSEFCEIKKKYDAARERLETDVKDITELIQVHRLTITVHRKCSHYFQEREGAYIDYADASALKYSHVPSASRYSWLIFAMSFYFIHFWPDKLVGLTRISQVYGAYWALVLNKVKIGMMYLGWWWWTNVLIL